MYKILIVDDEKDIVSFLETYFISEDYEVVTAYSGSEALDLADQSFDVILLDINMPDLDGLDVCKRIRESVTCPILFLTARVQDHEVIEGLAYGADDYLLKPINIDVLGAKVRSHLRREERETVQRLYKRFGDVTVYYDSYQFFVRDDEIKLTKREFEIIALLSQYPNQIFDKERIYESIWGYDGEGDSTVVTELVKRIRAKFQKYDMNSLIHTVWGVGYKWQS